MQLHRTSWSVLWCSLDAPMCMRAHAHIAGARARSKVGERHDGTCGFVGAGARPGTACVDERWGSKWAECSLSLARARALSLSLTHTHTHTLHRLS
jgi:hypothetical protein